MLRHARNKVNARRFDARVAEDVRKLDDVLVCAIKCRREQVAQIVRENFPCVDARAGAQFSHFRPNLISRHGLAAFGAKDRAGSGFLPRGKFEQLAAKLGRQQNGTDFTFQSNFGLAVFGGLNRDLLHLADANTGGADGLHQEREGAVARSFRRGDETFILCSRQSLLAVPEQASLNFEEPRAAIRPAAEMEESVQRCQISVDRRRRVGRHSKAESSLV